MGGTPWCFTEGGSDEQEHQRREELTDTGGEGAGVNIDSREREWHLSYGKVSTVTSLLAANMVDRILRLLVAYYIVSCTVETNPNGGLLWKYDAAPVFKHFTKNQDGVSMAALCLPCQDKVVMDMWSYLKAYGMSAFEYNGTDPRFNRLFNDSMMSHSTILMKKLL
ncbi:hypothetical protein GW17_00031358 [Ensete ventricosum]|nr:hypothetical protein GW17_00031358 [Ensete ventricosum]